MIIVLREVVDTGTYKIDSTHVMGVWSDEEKAKDYVRSYAARYFEKGQMKHIDGIDGSLFMWQCPGVASHLYVQRFKFFARSLDAEHKGPALKSL